MRFLLLSAAGGAIGAGARHLANAGFGRWLGAAFPWSTLAVNVLGCLAMGVLAAALVSRSSDAARIFIGTGILGGFTTFSAFSLDFAQLIERKQGIAAALYLSGSVGLSIMALFLGLALGRMVWP